MEATKELHKWSGKLGADAGSIQVMDEEFINEYKGKINSKLCHVVEVPTPGNYRIKVNFADTYNGPITDDIVIEVKGTKIVIGDACYNFDGDAWSDVLEATNMLDGSDAQWYSIQTGGNGSFDVELSVESVE